MNEPKAEIILLLDEDLYFRQIVSRLLKIAGYQTFEAGTAIEAYDIVSAHKPTLAIVDHRVLSSATGVSWLEQMQRSDVPLPMLFLAGTGIDQKVVNMLRNKLNVPMIVPRPINPASLLQQIQSMLISGKPVVNNDSPDGDPAKAVAKSANALGATPDTKDDAKNGAKNDADVLRLDIEMALNHARLEYILDTVTELNQLMSRAGSIDITNHKKFMEVYDLAHKIRGTSGSFGLMEISQLAGTLEDLMKAIDLNSNEDLIKMNGPVLRMLNELLRSVMNAVWSPASGAKVS